MNRAWLLIFFLLPSCSLFGPRPLFDEGELERATATDQQAMLEALSRSGAELVSARTLWEITFKHLFADDKVKQSLVFKRPSKLRAEYFERASNQLLFIMMVKGEQLKAFDYRDDSAYLGSARREDLAKLLAIPLTAEEIMLLFTGRYPIPRTDALTGVDGWLGGDNGERVGLLELTYLDGSVVRLRFPFPQVEPLLEAAQVRIANDDEEEVWMTFSYEEGSRVPSKVTLHVEERDVTIEARLMKFKPNPQFRNEEYLFDFPFPDGVKVYRLVDQDSFN